MFCFLNNCFAAANCFLFEFHLFFLHIKNGAKYKTYLHVLMYTCLQMLKKATIKFVPPILKSFFWIQTNKNKS